MTFTTLEQRYNEVSKQIYNRFAPNRDQLVVVKPNTSGVFGSKSRVKNDSRLLPTVSFLRDTRRITKFLTSSEGLLFSGKQLLLQTGNTFINTRVWGGPLTTIMLPGTHKVRHLDRNGTPGQGGVGLSNLKQPVTGLLQIPTINDFNYTTPPIISGNRPPRNSFQGVRNTAVQRAQQSTSITNTSILPDVSTLLSPLKNFQTAIITPIGDKDRKIEKVRPEFKVYSSNAETSYNPFLRLPQALDERRRVRDKLFLYADYELSVDSRMVKYGSNRGTTVSTTDYYLNAGPFSTGYIGRFNSSSKVYEYTYDIFRYVTGRKPLVNANLGDSATAKDFLERKQQNYDQLNVSVSGSTLPGTEVQRNIKYFKTLDEATDNKKVINYNILNGEVEPTVTKIPDIINFAFQTNDEIIRFRALISSLKQNVKPEFTEQRYVGRTERFVTYGGAKRSATLQFNVVAFSAAELDAVWTKINYLTGLAFPLSASPNGFMVPPLFKISVGNIYEAQPCYIDNLDFDFIDDSITFDVDRQVSQYINVNMSIILLEKRSKFYNSPFYEITQKLLDAPEQVQVSQPTQPVNPRFRPVTP